MKSFTGRKFLWQTMDSGSFYLSVPYFDFESFSSIHTQLNPRMSLVCDRRGRRETIPPNAQGGGYFSLSVTTCHDDSSEHAEIFIQIYLTFSEAIEAFEVEVLPYLKDYALNLLKDLETI